MVEEIQNTMQMYGPAMLIAWGITAVIGVMLYFSFKSNKLRLLNGGLATLLVLSFGISMTGSIVIIGNPLLTGAWFMLALVVLLIILAISAMLGVLLLWNAILVWRREAHTLSNSLTLIIAIYVLLSPLLFNWFDAHLNYMVAGGIRIISGVIIGYFVFWMINFTMSFLLYVLFRPKLDQKYIIVLGAGLLNGTELSNLLKSRIDVALKFAQRQVDKGGEKPLIILSGGQGPDEDIPEGRAMREYALSTGYPADLLIAEEESKTTTENMIYSKKIVEANDLPLDGGIFATSDYHVFRAAGNARIAGLTIDGIGARTRRYFVYNALLREYIALLSGHKLFHAVSLTALIIFNIIFVVM
ncbi:YdcF family protein [Weissella tructae]|uniref:DUF218 domain-containing protein n=2 Tax=Weissella TaxID=46255 RepID=A0A075TYY2_9LACO|nr:MULTISPECIES: YdcF family protein [Weissella]AIG65516.1 hypothetical protein WS08_0577 [Weissella tructae]AIM62830.1 hypothetical protein WS74_0578 [Weissella ceti]AIM64165.1 hypothetical protein WS105_0575 [Weissella ceti]ELA07025.1 hypothetical protein WCNC_05577 [Weissella ceti NC36]QVV91888.1 YdcF family protein [Weissella tructae]